MFESAKFTGVYEFLIFLAGEISNEFSARVWFGSREKLPP